jgi:YHS domain-containing protein
MSVTDQWQKLTAKREDKVFMWVLCVLLIILGYLVGYWSSETKKASPIVFQGISAVPTVLSDADITVLTDAIKATPVASIIPRVAGKMDVNSEYVASINGTKYYFTSCAEVKRIKEENQVFFKTEQEAIDAGYEPSVCVTKGN